MLSTFKLRYTLQYTRYYLLQYFVGVRKVPLYYFTPGFMCISTQQLVRDWDKSYSSGIWDGKNDSTIGNEMVKVSGQTVGSGTGERVSKSGTGWEAGGR